MILRNHILALVMLIASGAYCISAKAELVTFAIEGETTLFTDGNDVGWTIPNGTKLTGTFTFDTSVPDSNPDEPNRGRYFDSIVDLRIEVDGYSTTRTGLFNHIFVHDDLDGNDQYVLLDTELSFRGFGANFSFLMADSDESIFDSDALPIAPPQIDQFEYAGFILRGDNHEFGVDGVVTSLTVVPEPGTLLLLAPAMFLIRRCHSWR